MSINRRQFITAGTVSTAAVALGGFPHAAWAFSEKAQTLIDAFAAGAVPAEGKITLTAPEIAENGNTVPVEVSVESPMSEQDYVTEIMLLGNDNPAPSLATFKYSPASGLARTSTRIRLAKTQDVIALAKMSDGRVFVTSKSVKVTIGGCGG